MGAGEGVYFPNFDDIYSLHEAQGHRRGTLHTFPVHKWREVNLPFTAILFFEYVHDDPRPEWARMNSLNVAVDARG